jgi:hypothetical protein
MEEVDIVDYRMGSLGDLTRRKSTYGKAQNKKKCLHNNGHYYWLATLDSAIVVNRIPLADDNIRLDHASGKAHASKQDSN